MPKKAPNFLLYIYFQTHINQRRVLGTITSVRYEYEILDAHACEQVRCTNSMFHFFSFIFGIICLQNRTNQFYKVSRIPSECYLCLQIKSQKSTTIFVYRLDGDEIKKLPCATAHKNDDSIKTGVPGWAHRNIKKTWQNLNNFTWAVQSCKISCILDFWISNESC